MNSEIAGLTEKHAYLKLGNNVARFAFDYIDFPILHPAFVPRVADDEGLAFDRKTLKPETEDITAGRHSRRPGRLPAAKTNRNNPLPAQPARPSAKGFSKPC